MKIDDLIGKIVVFYNTFINYIRFGIPASVCIYFGAVTEIRESTNKYLPKLDGAIAKTVVGSDSTKDIFINTKDNDIIFPLPIIFETEEDARLYCELQNNF